jgi:hypothetical protein
VSVNIGGGFSPAVGRISRRLDNGWNITGGVAYNVPRSPFSIGAQFLYNGLGVNRTTLDLVGAPNGDANVWAITAEPRLRIPTGSSSFHPYVVGGVGYYRRAVHFTQPAILPVTVFDPFFGIAFPTLIGTNQVIREVVRSGIGGNLGGGFSIGLGRYGASIFTEARYHYASTGAVPTRLIPVTFGIRF